MNNLSMFFSKKDKPPSQLSSMQQLRTVKDYQQLAIALNEFLPELELSFSAIFPEKETRFAVSYCFDQNPSHIVIALASQVNQRRYDTYCFSIRRRI